MKKILFINACVRPTSRTLILAQQVLRNMAGQVEEVRLEQENLSPLDWTTLQERDALVGRKDFSGPLFCHARQFIDADEIVIAAPYWDLSFPATLRIYLEAVAVCGLSFTYTPEGQPKSGCKAKKLIYVTTAGGPIGDQSFGFDYVKALAQTFFEIPHIRCYQAENLDIQGADVDRIIRRALEGIDMDKEFLLS